VQRSHSFACTHLLTMATLAAVGALNTASAQTIGVATGGAGGAIPALGTGGGGIYPTVLPPSPGVFTLPVATVPAGATVVSQVNLVGLSHARVGDLQFVLIDPFGSQHNVSCRVGDYACGYSGNYQLFPTCTGIGQPLPASCVGGGSSLLAGAYDQNFGAGALLWPSGTNGIFNSDLYVIPAATGAWTLMVYDWSAGALGSIASWEIGFGVPNCTPGGGGPPVTPPQPTCIAPPQLSTQLNPVTIEWSASTSTASNSRSTHKAKWRPLSGQGGGATQIGLQAFTNPNGPT
jgi:subtilisin-like proprotein convertase family protein